MSGTQRTSCRTRLRAGLRGTALTLCSALAGSPWLACDAAAADWDCQVGAGGGSWVCSGDPQAVEPPPDPPRADPTPPSPTAPRDPSPADSAPARPAAARTVPSAAPARPTSVATDLARTTTDAPHAAPLAPAAPIGRAATATGADLDVGIDWDSCVAISAGRLPTPTAPSADDAAQPIDVTADAAVAEIDAATATFSGAVVLVQGSLQFEADRLTLNQATGQVDASGQVLLRRPDIRVAGNAANYQLRQGTGFVEQASYRLPASHVRGDAARADFLGQGLSRYQDITYTTCRPGDDDWLLRASTLELDQIEGVGRARHASLRFLGVPILYAPYFSFPIDNRRRSGFLVPSIGQSSNSGFDLSVPYYFNLAPNYDLTLSPRLLAKRGMLLGGEFRFLTESSRGTLIAEYLPDDREYQADDAQRGSASLRTVSVLNPRTVASLQLNYASDSDYLRDLGSSLAVTSATHLERTGQLNYLGDHWRFLGRLQGYQTIDDRIAVRNRPYSRLPQLLVSFDYPQGVAGTTYQLDAEYVNFYREDSVRGQRIDLFPALSLPLQRTWGYLEPSIGARYTAYDLTDQAPGLDTSPDHFTGVFSLDAGLFFDRSTHWFGSVATQTLEPRLFYLYVPADAQDDQPVFDTAPLDFNFDNLFRVNRFNGADRIGDANQLALALTSRMLSDERGAELARASLGHILYFDDREVTLPGQAVEDQSSSAWVAEVSAELGAGWRTRLGIQWDPHNDGGNVDQGLAQLHYRDAKQRLFNVAYRLRDGVAEQTDLAAFWPVSERFALIGRHYYSLQENRLLEALAGVEYGRCCWRVRALLRQYTDTDGDDHNLAFMLQLELNGLGRLGQDIQSTLERGIYGYRDN